MLCSVLIVSFNTFNSDYSCCPFFRCSRSVFVIMWVISRFFPVFFSFHNMYHSFTNVCLFGFMFQLSFSFSPHLKIHSPEIANKFQCLTPFAMLCVCWLCLPLFKTYVEFYIFRAKFIFYHCQFRFMLDFYQSKVLFSCISKTHFKNTHWQINATMSNVSKAPLFKARGRRHREKRTELKSSGPIPIRFYFACSGSCHSTELNCNI